NAGGKRDGEGDTVKRLQDRYWSAEGLGGALREEVHFDGRRMLCYSERPADLNALLADAVARFPDRPATVEGATLTYRAFDAAVAGLAAGLAAHGIGKGDRVG